MRNPAVNWSEGMFLRPHHFQAADRYWSELLAHQVNFSSPYSYGLQRIFVSTDALANGVLEFGGLRARWNDGALIAQEENHVERVVLGERLNSATLGNQPITAYLALPALQLGQANVSQNDGGMCRHVQFQRPSDEESVGGNSQEIALRKLNYRVLFSTEELTGFDLIPLVRLVRSATDEGSFQIDTNYFPPSLTIQSWPELAGVVRAIYDVVGSRIQALGDIVREKNITLSSQTQGDLEKIFLLHALNESYGELSCLAFASGVHPLVAYTSLCRIVGRCSIFGPGLTIENVPKYDHEDLATIFKWALETIRKLIYQVKEDSYVQRYFKGSGRGMAVQLESEWFGVEWDWYFGVDPVALSRDECMQLLKRSIDWRLGSADEVEKYMTVQREGVILKSVPQAPRALPGGKWIYFLIKREGDAWQQVQVTNTMAIRVKTEQIANLDSLEGSRRLRLAVGAQTHGLEFAIFAVRRRV